MKITKKKQISISTEYNLNRMFSSRISIENFKNLTIFINNNLNKNQIPISIDDSLNRIFSSRTNYRKLWKIRKKKF